MNVKILSPKPRPRIPFPPPRPKVGRLPRRPHPMTLVAAFRCQKGGILLCADREESDGNAKREVDKIYRIREFVPCEIYLAGSGSENIVRLATEEIHASFTKASAEGDDVLTEHRGIVEQSLGVIYGKFPEMLSQYPMNLIVVVVPRSRGAIPLLYHTDAGAMIPESFYVAHGSGKTVADYLSDRLYRPYQQGQLGDDTLLLLAAFICREAEASSPGVGLGIDMRLIRDEAGFVTIFPDQVKKIQDCAPKLAEALYGYWKSKEVGIPEKIAEGLT
jgi:20S proteasome alpha/beta subunit